MTRELFDLKNWPKYCFVKRHFSILKPLKHSSFSSCTLFSAGGLMGRVRWPWSSPVRRWRVWSVLCFRTRRGELQLWPKSNRFLNKKEDKELLLFFSSFGFFASWQIRLYVSEFNWNSTSSYFRCSAFSVLMFHIR